MAVKMRLMRMGKKRSAHYRVVVIDGRAPRDGRYIDLIGRYDPSQQPSLIEIDSDKAVDWLRKGAQPTDPVRKLLEVSGAMSKFKVASGQIHTVAARPAPAPAEEAQAIATEAPAETPPAEMPPAEIPPAEIPPAEAPSAEGTTAGPAGVGVDVALAEVGAAEDATGEEE
jgi:small subunit ribosomal protein S16